MVAPTYERDDGGVFTADLFSKAPDRSPPADGPARLCALTRVETAEVTLAALAVAPLAFAVFDRATARVTATGQPVSVHPSPLVNRACYSRLIHQARFEGRQQTLRQKNK
jgi:hypothetical protein